MTLHYSFQPDCYRPDEGSPCVQAIDRLDLGPQIAVWIQSADGTQYVDDLMVTNLTAVRGLGNRPGIWNFMSGPLFPYGKRAMSLPIWARARGRLYTAVVFQDGYEDQLGYHEPVSSPELYFCRPLEPTEVNVDAITCPTSFNSSKGALATATWQDTARALVRRLIAPVGKVAEALAWTVRTVSISSPDRDVVSSAPIDAGW